MVCRANGGAGASVSNLAAAVVDGATAVFVRVIVRATKGCPPPPRWCRAPPCGNLEPGSQLLSSMLPCG